MIIVPGLNSVAIDFSQVSKVDQTVNTSERAEASPPEASAGETKDSIPNQRLVSLGG